MPNPMPQGGAPGADPASSQSMFSVPNCDGSFTPSERVGSASQYYNQRVAVRGIDCSNGFEDACQALETARQCLSAAHQLASDNFPVPVDTSGAAAEVGGKFVEAGSAYLSNSADTVVSDIGRVSGFALKILGVVSTVTSLASAYSSCAP